MLAIIGGIGPLAGVLMAENIILNNKVNLDQDHIPFVLISFPNEIKDRTEFLLGKVSENPAIPIARQIISIETLGITHVVIACNTAHSPEILNVVEDILRQNK